MNEEEIDTMEAPIDGAKKRISVTVPQAGTVVLMLIVSDGTNSDADFIYITAN